MSEPSDTERLIERDPLVWALSYVLQHADYDLWKSYIPEYSEEPEGENIFDLANLLHRKLKERKAGIFVQIDDNSDSGVDW